MPNVAIGHRDEELVKKQLESGRYNNASKVVRAALRHLEDYEAACEQWLNNEIPTRIDELVKNPSIGVPAETVRFRSGVMTSSSSACLREAVRSVTSS